MKKIIVFFFILTLGLLFAFPVSVLAQAGGPGIDRAGVTVAGGGLFTTLFGCSPSLLGSVGGRVGGVLSILFGESGILCILERVLMFILATAFIVAVIFLVVGGYRYVVSQGNEEAVEKAKKTIWHSIVGIIVIVSAWVILSIVLSLFESGNP